MNLHRNLSRKFGFLKDQEGIINRYLREKGGWEPHLRKTKEFILSSSASKNKSKAMILGSGWLLDIPLEELNQLFEEIILVDIKHPRQIWHKIKKYPRVKLIETDITGLTSKVYEILKKNSKTENKPLLSSIKPFYDKAFIDEIQKSDFVVSVNLLNQLDILICDYIKKTKRYDHTEINNFRKYIQTEHICLLPKNKSALVTDYEELNFDSKNLLVNRKNLLYVPFQEKLICDRWTWDFDFQKTYHKDYRTIFKVMALNI